MGLLRGPDRNKVDEGVRREAGDRFDLAHARELVPQLPLVDTLVQVAHPQMSAVLALLIHHRHDQRLYTGA